MKFFTHFSVTSAISICLSITSTGLALAQHCGPENATRELPRAATNWPEYNSAEAAAKSGNFEEALRIYHNIDIAGEQEAANLPINYPWRDLIISKNIHVLADARLAIGAAYQNGNGVRRDYTEAAKWYNKAFATEYCGRKPFTNAALNLGRMYAYGQGVPQNRAKARELWLYWKPQFDGLVRLLDENALPKTMADWDSFNFREAIASLDAKKTARGPASPVASQAGAAANRQPSKGASPQVDAQPSPEIAPPKPKPLLPDFKFDL